MLLCWGPVAEALARDGVVYEWLFAIPLWMGVLVMTRGHAWISDLESLGDFGRWHMVGEARPRRTAVLGLAVGLCLSP